MAVPKRKTTPSKRDMRRANHDKVTPVQVVACPNCGEAALPHRACGACGFYKGRKAKAVKATTT
ncbi:MAG TPA: 50S ribosomal protein L32 [Polyangium sp.]|uniref:Large ribosomal subunit protein bL32 n=3 Tax=Polyangium TaxID=55 RepID=A0A4U1J7B2_9BACT|nr:MULTISPECIES: 50S ribosomal protein L32 [Polyangium]HVK65826.1 50S ribosomal protein L32 [Polyangium sp.]MDC3957131.1 50S ribosomal protein L32 [Polyangium jinanense]MDC3986839.1 50S ribosomal protein L32 [Polyangium jinanense]MDI1434179.1 50S ribosomal protein L32 [Polyangium sorediatum]MDI3288530.1 50S ribosomal protein L32 [Polyangium sp. 15x6]